MKLSDLITELQRIPNRHPLTYTNVDRVHIMGTDVAIETDVSDLQEQLDDANKSIAAYEAEEDEHKTDLLAVEQERDDLARELSDVRDLMRDLKDPESGVTVAQYKQDAEQAKERADASYRAMDAAQKELKALRQRKGVAPELFANGRDLILLVWDLSRDNAYGNIGLRMRAQELIKKIPSPSYGLPRA